ncbi:flocculation-associated PEP-CTERM protein PepA [Nitrosospira briensis]|uniref:flocculation-associated PEP-CTERM protein PepA n=1 Tax=Nitrosospira briensis TaxID=35799 RepID=UPI0008E95388|nr:flocculation-associated PEP-CTERM protein PepA [Nitrosospira briensis]SFO22646.1 PEP-CTERM protein-sorting domain-containing protein [Nitrosospira briensis]
MKSFRQNVGSLLTAGTLGTLLASSSVFAAPLFQVQESVAGGAANVVTADRISFEYHARIDQTITGGSLAGNDDNFIEEGFLTKAAFGSPTGGSIPSQLNSLGPEGYGMYGIFTITGEADPLGAGGIQANFDTAVMTLFIDPGQDTVLALPAAGPVVPGGVTADDFAIINFTLSAGEAHIFGGLANGDFDTLLNVSLTAAGQAYFIDPVPFFPLENFGGNTETFTGGSLTESFIATADGGGIELFQTQVPEPGTLALLGLGIMGMGFISRRRIKSA